VKFLACLLLLASPLLAEVQDSILPLMDCPFGQALDLKINKKQHNEMSKIEPWFEERVRVSSFNMLFNVAKWEEKLKPENRWAQRAPRLIEYLQFADLDLIGCQELQQDQLDLILCELGDQYLFFGENYEGVGEISAILYKKERFQLLEGKTYFYSSTPGEPSLSPEKKCNTFVVCCFGDRVTQKTFSVINTHFNFSSLEERWYEANVVRKFVRDKIKTPLILMGDLNTFPFRQQLDLPFYDGDEILSLLEATPLSNTMRSAKMGHFGPISSTNFNAEEKQPFACEGTPGVILDHVFVDKSITVISHGIDPAKVNGHYLSDHFPVIVDLLIN
jgi:endonuclease/exonuclease/phosphatase family metal-dependent hydrolase